MPSVLNELPYSGQSNIFVGCGREGGNGREGRRERELEMELQGNAWLHASQYNFSLRTAKSSIMPTNIIKCLI